MKKQMTALAAARILKRGRYAAGDGVYLQVTKAGTKSWLFLYMLDGKSHAMGLGSVTLVTLANARELGRTYRRLLLSGVDPLSARNQEHAAAKARAAAAISFKTCASRELPSAPNPAPKRAKLPSLTTQIWGMIRERRVLIFPLADELEKLDHTPSVGSRLKARSILTNSRGRP